MTRYAVAHHPSVYSTIEHSIENCFCPSGLGQPVLIAFAGDKEREKYIKDNVFIFNSFGYVEKFRHIEPVTAAQARKHLGRREVEEAKREMA